MSELKEAKSLTVPTVHPTDRTLMGDKGRSVESDYRQRLYGVFKGKESMKPTVRTNRQRTEARRLIRDIPLVVERRRSYEEAPILTRPLNTPPDSTESRGALIVPSMNPGDISLMESFATTSP